MQDLINKFVNDLSDIIKREAMSAVTNALLPPKPIEPAAPAPEVKARKKPGPKPGSKRKAGKKTAGKKTSTKKGGK